MQYGTSPVVQRLRHHSSTARGTGSILDQGNKILSSMAKKLKKKKVDIVVRAEKSGNYSLLSESETSFCEDCII